MLKNFKKLASGYHILNQQYLMFYHPVMSQNISLQKYLLFPKFFGFILDSAYWKTWNWKLTENYYILNLEKEKQFFLNNLENNVRLRHILNLFFRVY